MNEYLLISIILLLCFILIVFGVICIIFYEKKNSKENTDLEVGDVLLYKFVSENPFEDVEYRYETVKEVRKNKNGKLYFLSYTSDKNGIMTNEQSKYSAEHRYGKKYFKSEWDKVNHINLNGNEH